MIFIHASTLFVTLFAAHVLSRMFTICYNSLAVEPHICRALAVDHAHLVRICGVMRLETDEMSLQDLVLVASCIEETAHVSDPSLVGPFSAWRVRSGKL